jgi:hypothetical protein
MKTDLSKILSVSGHSGLYLYIAQARNGAIVESLADKKRTIFDVRSRITSLGDISIFTEDGELKLKEVFLKMNALLDGKPAPSPKAPADEITGFFAKAVPDYDETRFYVSHMKKVLDWYGQIEAYASFDFVDEDAPETEEEAQQQ